MENNFNDCVFDMLFEDLIELAETDEANSCLAKAIKKLARYELNKIEELKEMDDMQAAVEIMDERILNFFQTKLPLLFEAFDKDPKEYLSVFQKDLKQYIEECGEKEEVEEILYEDEDLKVLVKDGVKKVEYKNEAKILDEDNPLTDLINKIFESISQKSEV